MRQPHTDTAPHYRNHYAGRYTWSRNDSAALVKPGDTRASVEGVGLFGYRFDRKLVNTALQTQMR